MSARGRIAAFVTVAVWAIGCRGPTAPKNTVVSVASLDVTQGGAQGQTVAMPLDSDIVVTARSSSGSPVGGVSLTFAAEAGSVTPTSALTDDQGRASATWTLGTVAGEQSLEVRVSGDTAISATVTAVAYADLPDSMFLLAGDHQFELPGMPLPRPIQVKVVDRYGNGVSDAPIVFTVTGGGSLSPDTSEIPTDLDGVASAVWTLGSGVGAESVTAALPDSSVGDVTNLKGSPVTFDAQAVAFAFDSVAPTPPVVGMPVTLYGMGFAPDSSENTVTIGGVAARITGGTQTSLTVVVPSFGCTPEQDRTIAVTRGADSLSTTSSVRPEGALDLAVGGTAVVSDPADFCLQFLADSSGTDDYLVGLTATAPVYGSLAFGMTGDDGVNPPPAPAGVSVPAPSASAAPSADAAPTSGDLGLRSWESTFFQKRPALAQPVSDTRTGFSLAPAPPSVGDTMTYRVPNITTDPCNDYTSTLATVLDVAPNVVIASDATISSTLQTAIAPELDSLAAVFGGTIYGTATGFFGVPTDHDGNGAITLLLSSAVQPLGVATFVTAVDFTAPSTCPASNGGEIIYVAVPATPTASDLQAVFAQAPPRLAHDLTNLIQFARRIATGGVPLAPWLAEAQAELGTEVAGLAIRGDAPQMDYGWSVVNADTTSRAWYEPEFDRLSTFFGWDGGSGTVAGAPDRCSLYGFTGLSVPCVPEYAGGAEWSFLRYVSDQIAQRFSGGEAAFQSALIGTDSTTDGTQALAALTGSDVSDLVVDWAMALYADGRVSAAAAPQLQMTSWNLADIFGALPADQQLVPAAYTFTSFKRSGSVVGGGTDYARIAAGGGHGPLALSVRDAAGATLGTELQPRLWVVRIK